MTNQRGSVLPAAAFLFGAAVVVLIFGYMLWPKDEEIFSNSTIDTNKVVNTNTTNENANTANGNTNATNENVNATTDATKDWKTYENKTYGYTIKYPKEYNPSGTDHHYQFLVGTVGQPGPLVTVMSMTATNGDDIVAGASSDYYDNRAYDWAMAGFPANSPISENFRNKKTEKVGNKTFTVFEYDLGGSLGSDAYFFVDGKTVFRINSKGSSSNKTIISTFTLTN